MFSKNTTSALFVISILVFAAFGIIRWLQIPSGTIIDWITGIAAFWWLMAVVTLPWDMYFRAREIITDAKISVEKNSSFKPEDEAYAKKISRIYLVIAIVLHLISAVALYGLSYFHISSIGYWASAIALLLTFVRPLYRLQEYIVLRLNNIQQTILYPREDIYAVKDKVEGMENRIYFLEQELNREREDSFVAIQLRETDFLKNEQRELKVMLETLKVENITEHRQLAKKSEDSLAKLSEDAQFLNQVRELIRFVKNA
jgi:hypothetical protein